MTDESTWVQDRIREEYGAGALPAGHGAAGEEPPLEILDRDDSELEDGTRDFSQLRRTANVVSVATVDEDDEAIGSDYDHRKEAVVNLQLEGVHYTAKGRIDPDGDVADTAPWNSLKRFVRRAVLRHRTYPDVGRPDVQYHSLLIQNATDQSRDYGDFYRLDLDIVFEGYEALPQ